MQKNQIVAMLLCFVFLLMFVMIFVTMRLVNIFNATSVLPPLTSVVHLCRAHNSISSSNAKSALSEDRALDGDDGVTTVTGPATTTV
ncbi:hypothetical protein BPOR_0075g00150 [Botrytis porri]|uniref:Uncharacterized protein n=1 Tax=Botrytis porri TaxID=87229 RepID=A0A4Z1L007_9HELO|nr:hypothetical protein BPOR_0075g00150 [Botrytis porri]